MAKPITLDELMAELNRLGMPDNRGADGYTITELTRLWQLTRAETMDVVRRCLKEELATAGKGKRPAMDGAMRHVPVYLFKLPSKATKRRIRELGLIAQEE